VNDDMQDRLAAYCARAFPDREKLRVTQVNQISDGWESDMYAFTVESGPAGARQSQELVLRVYPAEDARAKSVREFRGMRLLHDAGYPVPRVLVLERENSALDRPFVIMERVQGQMMWPQLFGAPEGEKQELLTLFCKLFVRLHTLEWRPFVCAQDKPFASDHDRSLQKCLAAYEGGNRYALLNREIDRLGFLLARFPVRGFMPIVEWLDQRRDLVPCQRPSVVHLDYHPGNILLGEAGSATVIDWTQVDVSDHRFDLAWTLMLVSTYEGEVWHQRILGEYERLAGARAEQFEIFEVFACVKRLYTVAAASTFGPATVGLRPSAETIMRRQMGTARSAYELLVDRTGIEVPEIEEWLAQGA
jgi:aminoglycoside phosphotransferase (APT) family kinase protein